MLRISILVIHHNWILSMLVSHKSTVTIGARVVRYIPLEFSYIIAICNKGSGIFMHPEFLQNWYVMIQSAANLNEIYNNEIQPLFEKTLLCVYSLLASSCIASKHSIRNFTIFSIHVGLQVTCNIDLSFVFFVLLCYEKPTLQ